MSFFEFDAIYKLSCPHKLYTQKHLSYFNKNDALDNDCVSKPSILLIVIIFYIKFIWPAISQMQQCNNNNI